MPADRAPIPEIDIAEMRQCGWTSTGDDEWFMPRFWGQVQRRILGESEDGGADGGADGNGRADGPLEARVPCSLTASEAWAFHYYFRDFKGLVKRRS